MLFNIEQESIKNRSVIVATEIKCEKKIIREIFSMWYCIPDYQRSYVWDTDQVRDLLEDTFAAYQENRDAQYFLGSMVLKINEKTDHDVSYTEYELLDGQQRLTTMFLILACMRDVMPEYASTIASFLYQPENAILQQPERMRILFNIRADVRDFVNEYIKPINGTNNKSVLERFAKSKDLNVSVRNMANTVVVARDFLEENKNELGGYLQYFLNKVLMIYVATEELQDAFQLFTVLNNRGVKLSSSDILKAENLKELSDSVRSDWAKKWEDMESYFGEDFDKFLSHIRTILVKKKASTTLLKEFEDNVYSDKEYDRTTQKYIMRMPLLTKGKETFDYIYGFYNTYMEVFEGDHAVATGTYEINNYLKLMDTGLGADYWVAPVMDYYRRYHTNHFLDFLKALDKKLSGDWIVSMSPSLRIDHVNDILRAIEKSATVDELLNSDVFDIDCDDFERVLRGDIYGKRYAKYLLLKLDLLYLGNTTPLNPSSVASIEHILPQNPYNDSKWALDFSEEDRDEWTDKLGNLVLISRRKNTAQGNLDFDKKKEKYFTKNVEVFPNSIRVYQKYNTWTLDDLKQNHNEVINKILMEYR